MGRRPQKRQLVYFETSISYFHNLESLIEYMDIFAEQNGLDINSLSLELTYERDYYDYCEPKLLASGSREENDKEFEERKAKEEIEALKKKEDAKKKKEEEYATFLRLKEKYDKG